LVGPFCFGKEGLGRRDWVRRGKCGRGVARRDKCGRGVARRDKWNGWEWVATIGGHLKEIY